MKKIIYLLFIPIIYSAFMIYKTPTISDAIIVSSLCALIGFIGYYTARYINTSESSELSKLEEELKIERLKLHIEQVKENATNERAIRDSRAATMGYQPGKEIKF